VPNLCTSASSLLYIKCTFVSRRLLFWDVSRGTLGDILRAVPLESPYGAGKDGPPKVRGLDWRPGEREGEGSIVVGTSR
jgi:hypothetical protein